MRDEFFEEGELSPESVIRKFRITDYDGKTCESSPILDLCPMYRENWL